MFLFICISYTLEYNSTRTDYGEREEALSYNWFPFQAPPCCATLNDPPIQYIHPWDKSVWLHWIDARTPSCFYSHWLTTLLHDDFLFLHTLRELQLAIPLIECTHNIVSSGLITAFYSIPMSPRMHVLFIQLQNVLCELELILIGLYTSMNESVEILVFDTM